MEKDIVRQSIIPELMYPTSAVINYRNGTKKTFLLQPGELLQVDPE